MPKIALHFKLLGFFLFFVFSGKAQNYIMLQDSFKCGASNSYSIYATGEDVDLLMGFLDSCDDLEYLRIVGYKPGSHWEDLFNLLSNYQKLKGLELYYNEGLEEVPKKISDNENLKVISIVGNRRMNYDDLFKKLGKLKNLESVSLIDNKLKEIPSSIGKIKKLKKLKVSGNEGVNYSNLISELSKNNGLEELSIPLNSISEIPENISELKKLKVLDIRKNYIAEFPESISKLDSLEEFKAEENIILDIPNELNKLKNLNIKYLSFDEDATPEDLKELKTIFPDALIESKKSMTASFVDEEKGSAGKGVKFKKEDANECWDAIDAYNSLFKKKYAYSDFDSTRFLSRLTDFDYCYNDRVLANGKYEGTGLLLHNKFQWFNKDVNYPRYKLNKDEIGFSFCPDGNMYPELKAFTGMVWIYVGGKNKKEFYKDYVKNKDWKDVYLEYDPSKKTFFAVLKGVQLEKIPVYPRYINRNSSLKDAQKQYSKKYKMYERRLNLRAKRFNEEIDRSKEKNDRIHKRWSDLKWNKLKGYMCDYEMTLSRDGWKQYRTFMIDKQHTPIDTLAASQRNFKTSLRVKRVDYNNRAPVEAKRNMINSVSAQVLLNFKDSVGMHDMPARMMMYQMDKALLEAYEISGSTGIEFPMNSKFIVILQRGSRYILLSKKEFMLQLRDGIPDKGEVQMMFTKPFEFYTLKELWKEIDKFNTK